MQQYSTQTMKQPEIYKTKDCLHELGMMGKNWVISGQMVCKLGGWLGMIDMNIQRTLRNLSKILFKIVPTKCSPNTFVLTGIFTTIQFPW